MKLAIASEDFLERAESLLKQQGEAFLLYAALELRYGIEARMREYASYAHGISKLKPREWEIGRLGKTIDSAFQFGDKILVLQVKVNEHYQVQFIYAPVTERLQKIGKRCGDYLHASGLEKMNAQGWQELKEMLHEGCGLLHLACSGEILRPTLKKGIRIAIKQNDPRVDAVKALQDGKYLSVSVMEIKPTGPILYVPAGGSCPFFQA